MSLQTASQDDNEILQRLFNNLNIKIHNLYLNEKVPVISVVEVAITSVFPFHKGFIGVRSDGEKIYIGRSGMLFQ